MREFAGHLLKCADEWGVTPVVLWDRELRVGSEFYSSLFESLVGQAMRPLRLECIDSLRGPWASWRHRKRVRLFKRIIDSNSGPLANLITVESRVVISRPAGIRRPLVVAIADEDVTLPIWSRGLRLTMTPKSLTDFQIIPT